MLNTDREIELTVVLTVVSGREAIRENLETLIPQIDFERAEIIVPFDRFSSDVGSLTSDFPKVEFFFIENSGVGADLSKNSADEHRLFDKRRSVGLQLSRGRIVAMTEDHALPAADWISQILTVHEQPYDIIGGAVENGIEKPLNRALYYCDFGRYGRPFKSAETSYASDVNIAYKREALASVRDVWLDGYHETTVHWELKRTGQRLFLDNRPVVYQTRKGITFIKALSERIGWGRIFAETRVREITILSRVLFALGSPLLPAIMLGRVFQHMRRQKRTIGIMFSTLPIAFLLLVAWSWGEFIGYLVGLPKPKHAETKPVRTSDSFTYEGSTRPEHSKQQ